MTPRRSPLILTVALGAFVLGCGGSDLKPVRGTVKFGDKPLAGANVAFYPVGKGPVGTATTDSDGTFAVKTGAQEGLKPGEYQISVIKTGEVPPESLGNPEVPPPRITPDKYANPKTSGLTYTVPGGSCDLELKSE